MTKSNSSRRALLSFGFVTLAVLIMVVSGWYMLKHFEQQQSATSRVHHIAAADQPTISTMHLTDIDDIELTLPTPGQVLLVNVFGSWCEPCDREAPALQEFYEQVEQEQAPVQLLGYAIDDTTEAVQQFAQKHDLRYPLVVAYAASEIRAHFSDELTMGVPVTGVVDPAGKLVAYHLGEIDAVGARELVDLALDGVETTATALK